MVAPVPQTVAHQIEVEALQRLFKGGTWDGLKDEWWYESLAAADKLAQVDAVTASSIKVSLYMLAGEFDNVEYWIGNIRKNGQPERAALSALHSNANFGFAAKTRKAFAELTDLPRDKLPFILVVGLCGACFSGIETAASAWRNAGGTLDEENTMIVELSKLATKALSQLAVTEDQVAQVLDAAGNVLRAHKLVWAGRHPELAVSAASDDSYVSLRYLVPVSASIAAGMNWELAEALAGSELMPAGVSVSFFGTDGVAVA